MNLINRPLVSVIMPVFNAEPFLRDSIESVLGQDYSRIELIAIDDGSTDDSRSILASYADKVRVIHQDNSGSARARNAGLKIANGEYIAFLDADDLWHPSKVRIQVMTLESNPEVGLVYNNWLVIEGDANDQVDKFRNMVFPTQPTELDHQHSGWLYCRLMVDSLVHTSAAMARADVLRIAGFFDESLLKGQDYDYWIRLSRLTQFCKLKADLSIYRIQAEGITKQPSPINYGAVVLKKALDTWGRVGPDGCSVSPIAMRERLSWIWYTFGCLHLDAGNNEIARQSFSKSWMYTPWRVGRVKKYLEASI